MAFKPPFEVGAVVSNAVMTEAFKIGNMGGMRRSKTTDTLVLISDNTKGLYHDKWKEGVLHYTGMGKTGDQVLTGNQNKTLAESGENGIEVHLFEVIGPGKYSYTGVVELAGKPYQETQPDDKGNPRKVWIFPLRKVEESATALTSVNGGETQEHNENPDDYGVKEQSRVYSKYYGEGVVTRMVDGKIYVDFEGKKRIFNYPDAFNNGWLTI